MSNVTKGVIAVVIVVAAVGGSFAAFHTSSEAPKQASATTKSTTPSPAPAAQATPNAAQTPASPEAGVSNFTIHAEDNEADKEVITVSKGSKVNLTFAVDDSGVYHGGLQFKSTDPAIDSGPIDPGKAKTVSFTADHSFSFTPYWYASQVKKDYQIQVQVQ